MTVLRREGTLSRIARREGGACLRIVVPRLLRAVLIPSTRTSLPSCLGDSFLDRQRRPEKADEFSCNRHDDFVVLLAS